MEKTIVTTLLLPLAVGFIMLGLGLTLTLADFTRVARFPKAVLTGLLVQTIVLAAIAYAVCRLFGLPPPLAVGLMLLAASPGGAIANIFSHLAAGDVALNITLTAINSLLALVWLPLVVNWSLEHFFGTGRYIPPPTQKLIEVGVIIILPVATGMLLRAKAPARAAKAEQPVRNLSVVILALLIATLLYETRHVLAEYLPVLGFACLTFNLVSMAVGYLTPLALRLGRPQATAIAMEIGVHNTALAMYVGLNVIGNGTTSIPAGVYSLVMLFTASVTVFYLNLRRRRTALLGVNP